MPSQTTFSAESPNAPLSKGGEKCACGCKQSVNTSSRHSTRDGKVFYFASDICQAGWVAKHPN
jgi:hypothetical protein